MFHIGLEMEMELKLNELNLDSGWEIVQDVHDLGETLGFHKDEWDPHAVGAAQSEWEPIDRLAHLQLLLAEQPYFGRDLRYFNEHPWWYRVAFRVPDEAKGQGAVLRLEGVDYFCKVWLNGTFLGDHEGYAAPFELDTGSCLHSEEENVLVVKVWSPWDNRIAEGQEGGRCFSVIRDLVKGTYEHCDTLIQRDVNPVGIWRPVKLVFHRGIRISERPAIRATLSEDYSSAEVEMGVDVVSDGVDEACVRLRILDSLLRTVASTEQKTHLDAGKNPVSLAVSIDRPELWCTWDRGAPAIYSATLEIEAAGHIVTASEPFGVRSVVLHRSADETRFELNGQSLFLRGTSYFPDVYLSAMHEGRWRRDLDAIRASGCNAIRVHVHTQPNEFYDLCDEYGIAVIQDSDLNWVHPEEPAWKTRAREVFGDVIRELRNHPGLIAWICANEASDRSAGEDLEMEAGELDPVRPTIRVSQQAEALHSGDSHNYAGSLNGHDTHFTDIEGTVEKLNTEFGFDAPPEAGALGKVPAVADRLQGVLNDIPQIQDYQYRLLKFYIEHYRLQKYDPCSGYFQFMFIDLCPQSFYGVYSWWGLPKPGLKALLESNRPIGIFMKGTRAPESIWVVNDLRDAFAGCTAAWTVTRKCGLERELILTGEAQLDIAADGRQRVADLSFSVDEDATYAVQLVLSDSNGRELATNCYDDPFHHPPHPAGHPHRMSHELGMRLYHG